MKGRLIKNEELNTLLEKQGYVVIDLLEDEIVQQFRSIYDELKPVRENAFYTSNMIKDSNHRRQVSDRLLPILKGQVKDHLKGCKCVYGYFLVKKGGEDSKVSLHQDWTLIDESKYKGLTLWCPLTDTNDENGTLNVIKYSHKIFNNIRGHNIDLPYLDIEPELMEKYLTPLYLKAGQAVLFDQRLVHASFPNLTEKPRVALGMTILPEEAQFIHYYKNENTGKVKVYQADDDFLINFGFQENPDHLTCIDEIEYENEQVSLEAFEQSYKSSWFADHAWHKVERKVFKEERLNEKMQEEGFVVLPLLDSEVIKKCLDLFGEVDPKVDKGFYTSLESADAEYRHQVNNRIKDIIGDALLKPFENYKSIGFTFNVKLPKEDSETPIHLDDCHVDEGKYVSVNAWMPLVDTDINNGTLHLIPKSHKVPHPVRALGMGFPYEYHLDFLLERMVPFSLKAGEVLLFDSRCIHWAPPNLSGKVRPAMVTGLIPQESEPIVFMRYNGLKKNKVEKFYAPFDFFSDVRIDQRPEGYKSYGMYEYVEPDFSTEELLSYLK